MDPETLLDGLDERIAGMRRRAETMRDEMTAVSVTERSMDGQIHVTVNYAGNLTGLEIGQAVRGDPALAQDILRITQLAQSKLADAMRANVPSIAGTETVAALDSQMRTMFPAPEPDDFVRGGGFGESERARTLRFDTDEPVAPKPAPRRRPDHGDHNGDDDDYYYSTGDFLR